MLYVNARLLKTYGRKVREGTVLFYENEPGNSMYVIYSGKVRISKKIEGREKTLVILQDGDFFGEMAIILKEPRTATATCVTDSEVLEIDSAGFDAMIRKSPDMALRTIKTLADRIKAGNEMLMILSRTDPEERVIFYIQRLARQSSTKVEDGVQISLDFKELIDLLGIREQDLISAMEKLKRSSLCYKLRQNFYVVTEPGKLGKFIEFLRGQKKQEK
ncbi:MAG: Crp/Fnr family transcriptional regulator [Oligoflexia bacterium]|nr:Crp/Fnr family transcriptional regulator [Oligoflexia bacterium]